MNEPRTNLLGLFKSHQWVLFKRTHHLSTGFMVGKLFQNPQCTHNVPTGYMPLRPQCEDPQDAAQEVDRADEREELQRRHLTMDDMAWREVMETEQLS